MADKQTVAIGPWPKGINNRAPDYAVPEGALRNAVDVDLTLDGRARRRQGYARIVTALDPHSLYTSPVGTFFAAQGTLYKLNDDDSTTAVLTGVVGRPLTYEYFNGDVYLSDGIIIKKLIDGTTVANFGVPTPSSAPLLAATSGNIAAGSFIGAVSFVTISGEESGLSAPAFLTTSTTGGVQFLAFPSPSDSAVVSIRLYLSTPGGSVLYHVGDIAVGTTNYTVSTLTDTGKEADLTVYSPPPACNIIRHKDGRMYFVVDDVVWYSEPFALGRIKTAHSFWQFPTSVTIFEPVESGIYVVADKTYFYRFTDPNEVKVESLFNYGAVPYTSVRLPHGEGVMWQSTRGAIMADEGGKAKNIQEENVATGTASTGAAVLREKDGLRQFVAALSDARTSSLTATDFMEAEIIRKGA